MDVIWDTLKNEKLKMAQGRNGVCFEDIEQAIEEGKLLTVLPSRNTTKYPGQYSMVVSINNYAYVVPYKIVGTNIMLITVYPSRKYTKQFLLYT